MRHHYEKWNPWNSANVLFRNIDWNFFQKAFLGCDLSFSEACLPQVNSGILQPSQITWTYNPISAWPFWPYATYYTRSSTPNKYLSVFKECPTSTAQPAPPQMVESWSWPPDPGVSQAFPPPQYLTWTFSPPTCNRQYFFWRLWTVASSASCDSPLQVAARTSSLAIEFASACVERGLRRWRRSHSPCWNRLWLQAGPTWSFSE